MAAADNDQYTPMIDAILSVSDLQQVTVKKIRNALQALFVVDLQPQKKEISELIMQRYYKLVDEREAAAAARKQKGAASDDSHDDGSHDGDPNNGGGPDKGDEQVAAKLHAKLNSRNLRTGRASAPKLEKRAKPRATKRKSLSGGAAGDKPKKKRAGSNGLSKPMRLSTQLIALLGHETLPRTQVVKELWQYIRDNNLQNPSDKRQIICDDKMEPIFGKKVTMFQLNKVLSRHLFTDDEVVRGSYTAADSAAQDEHYEDIDEVLGLSEDMSEEE